MSSIQIRQAGIVDVENVANLFDQYRQFYEQAPDIALATQFISDRIKSQQSVILIAETLVGESDEREIVGFCQMYPTFCSVEAAPIMVLYDLFVSETTRKNGAGRALMLAAQNYAKQNSFTRLDLSTAKTNHVAQTLYNSLGWVRDESYFTYSLATN